VSGKRQARWSRGAMEPLWSSLEPSRSDLARSSFSRPFRMTGICYIMPARFPTPSATESELPIASGAIDLRRINGQCSRQPAQRARAGTQGCSGAIFLQCWRMAQPDGRRCRLRLGSGSAAWPPPTSATDGGNLAKSLHAPHCDLPTE
jgi:hypothetical protein